MLSWPLLLCFPFSFSPFLKDSRPLSLGAELRGQGRARGIQWECGQHGGWSLTAVVIEAVLGAPWGTGLNTIFTERNKDFLVWQLLLVLYLRKMNRDSQTVRVSEELLSEWWEHVRYHRSLCEGPICQLQDKCSVRTSKIWDRLNVIEATHQTVVKKSTNKFRVPWEMEDFSRKSVQKPGAHRCNQVMKRNIISKGTDGYTPEVCVDSPLHSLPVQDASNPEETSDGPRWTDAAQSSAPRSPESRWDWALLLTQGKGWRRCSVVQTGPFCSNSDIGPAARPGRSWGVG